MAKDFTKDFIDLSDRSFSPNHCSKLHLNHRVSSLSIRPLVVMPEKGFSIEVVECQQVNNAEVEAKLTELRQKGWTLASIAREIGQAIRTVESWNQGTRSPANLQSVLISLDSLAKRKRIPLKKIYTEENRGGINEE